MFFHHQKCLSYTNHLVINFEYPMHNKIVKFFSFGLLSASLAFSATAFAEKKTEPSAENIDVTQTTITKDELAAIYVLSEICPSLIQTDAKFDAGYARLLKDYLPQEKSPITAIKTTVQQPSFKDALTQARADVKSAGDKVNTQVCNDVKDY